MKHLLNINCKSDKFASCPNIKIIVNHVNQIIPFPVEQFKWMIKYDAREL